MAFPSSLGLDFGSDQRISSTVDTGPISNEAFTGAFAVGAGATARTESQFNPDQRTSKTGLDPFSGGGAFPMQLVYVGALLIFGAIVVKKVWK